MTIGVDNTAAEKIIHDLIINVALKAALDTIGVAVPFLNLPVIHQVFVFLATKLMDAVYAEMAKVIAFSIIDFQVEAQQTAYDSAASDLKNVLITPPGLTEEEKNAAIEKAKADFKAKFAALINMPTAPTV